MNQMFNRLQSLYQTHNVEMSDERREEIQKLIEDIEKDINETVDIEIEPEFEEEEEEEPQASSPIEDNVDPYQIIFETLTNLGYELDDFKIAMLSVLIDDLQEHPLIGRMIEWIINSPFVIESLEVDPEDENTGNDEEKPCPFIEGLGSYVIVFLENYYERIGKEFSDELRNVVIDLTSFIIGKYGSKFGKLQQYFGPLFGMFGSMAGDECHERGPRCHRRCGRRFGRKGMHPCKRGQKHFGFWPCMMPYMNMSPYHRSPHRPHPFHNPHYPHPFHHFHHHPPPRDFYPQPQICDFERPCMHHMHPHMHEFERPCCPCMYPQMHPYMYDFERPCMHHMHPHMHEFDRPCCRHMHPRMWKCDCDHSPCMEEKRRRRHFRRMRENGPCPKFCHQKMKHPEFCECESPKNPIGARCGPRNGTGPCCCAMQNEDKMHEENVEKIEKKSHHPFGRQGGFRHRSRPNAFHGHPNVEQNPFQNFGNVMRNAMPFFAQMMEQYQQGSVDANQDVEPEINREVQPEETNETD
eukprot:TRINITY_DN1517_c0_g1_i1.p1 TRINITY_DN1517_c0_g1~~TRINITY_DN1517_c0_g1_i1.p1  ORF type:complete len:533 (+),score=161.76 TRINITY_DN1517_c0_g1_i1:31-1599(+)